MKKTEYIVINARRERKAAYNTKAEAEKAIAKAAAKGWTWTIKEVEYTIKNNAEWWEYEGYKADPEAVEWNREEW